MMNIYIAKATRKLTGEESFYILEIDEYSGYISIPWGDSKDIFEKYINGLKDEYKFTYLGPHKINYNHEYGYRYEIVNKLKDNISNTETYRVTRLQAIRYVSESTLTPKIEIMSSTFDIVNGHILYDQLYGNNYVKSDKKSKFQKFEI